MASVATVTQRALRILSVLDATEVPAAEDSSSAIDAINGMMRRWEASGLANGWVKVANPTDTVSVPDEALEAVIYNLAVRLAPEYQVQPSQITLLVAANGLNALRRDRMTEMPLRQFTDAPRGYQTGKYDILTDSWRR